MGKEVFIYFWNPCVNISKCFDVCIVGEIQLLWTWFKVGFFASGSLCGWSPNLGKIQRYSLHHSSLGLILAIGSFSTATSRRRSNKQAHNKFRTQQKRHV